MSEKQPSLIGRLMGRKSTSTPPARLSWWQRLKAGLTRTTHQLTQGIAQIFTHKKLDAAMLSELEDVLIQADMGIATAQRITKALSVGRFDREITPAEVSAVLASEIEAVLAPVAQPLVISDAHTPHVILVVGVNGTGKTTTIGKLASQLQQQGKRMVLAAGDTFRAAAIEQLKVWGERTGALVVARASGGDAAGLAYEALETAQRMKADVLIIDTAGRLHNKTELMN